MEPYPEEFYSSIAAGSRRSAQVIVPLVLDLVSARSVVDVGCGTGTWLSAFRECGVDDVYGIDGDYVNRRMLEFPEERFRSCDLTKPLNMDRTFDLVVSLEVAEHLPEECAGTFVESLTSLGSVILFSAAIPFQGGRHHVNEQWPEYWVERFRRKGYEVVDCIRRKVWDNSKVEWFYAQNMLIFATATALSRSVRLREERERTAISQLSIVHPGRYLEVVEWTQQVGLAARELGSLVPAEIRFILVDDEELRDQIAGGRRAVPFLEHEGQYWGQPADDRAAIDELERLRAGGAEFIVFAWPAFWWLDHYDGFHRYLRSRFSCVLSNDRLVAFQLAT